ncbi:MAG: RimK family alpha-L-glutamate ligase [Ornithinibacter sp.]
MTTAPAPVLLVTCRDWPEGEPGHDALDAALTARGIASRWVSWDDPDVDWAAAPLVAVRSTWDYVERLEGFLAWAHSVGPALLNGAAVFSWNTDKGYLLELERAGLPVVPTVVAERPQEVRDAVARFGDSVVKPHVGANGNGVEVVARGSVWAPAADGHPGPWVVQPLVASVREEGETSVFVIGGRAVSQVAKRPGPGEIRVHEHRGGSSRPVPLDPEAVALALEALATLERLLGTGIAYGRVDLMRHEGRLVLSEAELTEPGLYLDVLPGNAVPFAEAVADRL